MKKFAFLLITIVVISCGQNNYPDVSDIKIDLSVKRFDQDFFAIDTSQLVLSIQKLRVNYPGFMPDYFHNVLGLPLDSTITDDHEVAVAIKHFLHDYAQVKDSVEMIFKDFDPWRKQIMHGLQFVKYYFPDYHLPANIITFVGPFDAFFATSFGIQGDVLTQEGLGVGLQLHLGKDFSFFQSETGQELYPAYISQNFDPDHISVNCMRNIADDLFPSSQKSFSLIEQIVTSGRKYFLLTKFLPGVKDALIMSYTKEQMKGVYKNEAVIWDFFLNNDLLNNGDQNIIKNYVGPSPKTQEFGEGSPGNLGSFSGLQIVRKFMKKFPETTLTELMKMPPRDIYEQSKYKPKS